MQLTPDDDEFELVIQTNYFYKAYTPQNIGTARIKKAIIKNQNANDDNNVQWTCQQASTLLNLFPKWILKLKVPATVKQK